MPDGLRAETDVFGQTAANMQNTASAAKNTTIQSHIEEGATGVLGTEVADALSEVGPKFAGMVLAFAEKIGQDAETLNINGSDYEARDRQVEEAILRIGLRQ